jgi:hypothetical protein
MAEQDMGEFTSLETARDRIKENHSRILSYDTPWWGDKETDSGNMSNRGYVIGFKDGGSRSQWRLDYDPQKKLHVNWTHDLAEGTVKECYRISSNRISSIRPQDTMWDYYVAWTKTRADDIPAEIKARLDKVGGTKEWKGRYWAKASGKTKP